MLARRCPRFENDHKKAINCPNISRSNLLRSRLWICVRLFLIKNRLEISGKANCVKLHTENGSAQIRNREICIHSSFPWNRRNLSFTYSDSVKFRFAPPTTSSGQFPMIFTAKQSPGLAMNIILCSGQQINVVNQLLSVLIYL